MALTDEQAAQLAALEAERDAPEPRTTTGIRGVLHTLIDVASGQVAHLPQEAWDALHKQAEDSDSGQDHDTAPDPVTLSPFGAETSPEG